MADKKYLNEFSLFFFLLTFTLLLLLTSSTTMAIEAEDNISNRDLNAAIFALRSNGYNLFANSIAVSDLSFQLLTVSSTSHGGDHDGGHRREGFHGYTLLAPPNSALFSLDMSTDAFTYVHSLRFHVIPRRLSYTDLRHISLSSDPYVETLATGHFISVASSAGHVAVDGVLISFPDMHLWPKIAVHGLDGILVSSASRVEDLGFVAAPQPFAGAFSPEIGEVPTPTPTPTPTPAFSQEIGVPSPVHSFAPFSIENSFDSVSIPPNGVFFSKNAETPALSPFSPSPACSAWYDCELEHLAPYNWSPMSSPSPYSPSSSMSTQSADDYDDHVNLVKYDRDQVLPLLENW